MKIKAIIFVAGALILSCGKPSDPEPDPEVIPFPPVGFVDLGIVMHRPDGTSYHLYWAQCNLGATSSEGYGDYYAWGETEAKKKYNWETYKWSEGQPPLVQLTKYCDSDNRAELEPEDDVAFVKNAGRMPTADEMKALFNQCTWTSEKKYGVQGYRVSSKAQGNTNSIFIPAAGYKVDDQIIAAGEEGYYWTSSLSSYSPFTAVNLWTDPNTVDFFDNYRHFGFTIRPVSEW